MIPCALAERTIRDLMPYAEDGNVPPELVSVDHVDRPGLLKYLEAELEKTLLMRKKFAALRDREKEAQSAEYLRKMRVTEQLVRLIGRLEMFEATPILLRHHDTVLSAGRNPMFPRTCYGVLAQFHVKGLPYLLRSIESNLNAELREVTLELIRVSVGVLVGTVPVAKLFHAEADMLRENCDVNNPNVIKALQSVETQAKAEELRIASEASANQALSDKSPTEPMTETLAQSKKASNAKWWALLGSSIVILSLGIWLWITRSRENKITG